MPRLINVCAPMMERVRPAQLMTMGVLSSGTRLRTRQASSPLGQQTACGIFILWNSDTGRPSSTTSGSPAACRAASCCAVMRGVP